MSNQTLDTSDLDQYLGKQVWGSQLYDPVATNDIRRWVQAMHYPNRLHYDRDYAAEGRFGGVIAPQSFAVAMDSGHGAVPACYGKIPNSHLIFGGDEWWFYGPVIKPGDKIHNERFPVDYVVKETGFAGPTCFSVGITFTTTRTVTKLPRSAPPAFATIPTLQWRSSHRAHRRKSRNGRTIRSPDLRSRRWSGNRLSTISVTANACSTA